VAISNLALQKEENQPPALKIVLNREGNQSVYGDLSVDYTGTDGKQINVGLVKGIAVYTPNVLRRFTMPLNIPEGVELNKGKLLVRFSSSSEAKPETYDEKELGLN
jgi:hypothetical protein